MNPVRAAPPLVLALVLALSFGCAGGGRAQRECTEPIDDRNRAEWDTRIIGRSRAGIAIHVESYHASRYSRTGTDQSGPVLIIGGIHGDEQEGLGAIDIVRERAAGGTRDVLLIENLNPDGTAACTRENAAGVDLNRNWPTRNFRPSRAHGPRPLSEPETRAVHALIDQARPSLVIVLHSTPSGPFVNFDGPAGDVAARFADACERVDPRWRVVADMGYPTPGSLGTLMGDERGVPILTVEFRKGQDAASVRAALDAGLRAVLD